ncbi:glycerate kinase [Acidithiobacillus sp. CV18-2]|uniref:Glycerate kinase n=1 Tax=Igneacidithiobacillus copahuensis TaxID=2724909 RepID=A0AAE3CKH6_9PROT|nr:glycerate kinase [Igneacidithiobacillus copahuensis]MBU2753349.1 glycerate kinase [Acidithiobacillus sp. CV18-3]MBU2756379.1 glycerate kinase [Acidithiobacillus sp. BN09-2]MBU2776166.1 glycerate kinase [Acidithiobacillus sp. CV18-2]MBU2795779.1 glycerate kinase [Acidithiobacillus sp. VAN18-2]MBU2798294.1 glycerate kinase [Acidithiobacillus sp. VAN18-4]UTV81672.1 glycerate kinase [Acidithiobacillus sp. YTS05]
MQVLIVPDHFKGSLTAGEAASAMQAGFAAVFPDWQYQRLPLADGGEGTLDLLLQVLPGTRVATVVHDPLGREIQAYIGIVDGGHTAIIEMARASGLLLLDAKERDPLRTASTGTGEMIRAALDHGCQKIVMGIGGSASNDGGMGLLAALGIRFYDSDGQVLSPCGAALAQVRSIDAGRLDERLQNCGVEIICDVDNPLLGDSGATRMFGPQKGADQIAIEVLESGMKNFAHCIEHSIGRDIRHIPGSGAAGGVGAACLAFLGARLRPGIDSIADLINLDEKIRAADLILTGEGRIDAQTTHGKTIAGIAKRCQRLGKPLIVLAGSRSGDTDALREIGIDVVLTSLPSLGEETELFREGADHLRETARNTAALLCLGGRLSLTSAQRFG